MTWQQLDKRLRAGATLCCDSAFGAWIEERAGVMHVTVNVNRNSAKAVLRRDLVVVKEKRSMRCYAYRSKYPAIKTSE